MNMLTDLNEASRSGAGVWKRRCVCWSFDNVYTL